MTGGSGLLGSRLRNLLPDMAAPTSSEFDITDFDGMSAFIRGMKTEPHVVVHAAAYTKTHQAQRDAAEIIEKNIMGTCNVVRLCAENDWRLIYRIERDILVLLLTGTGTHRD